MRRTLPIPISERRGPGSWKQFTRAFALLVTGLSLTGFLGAEGQVSNPGQQPARRDLFVRAVQLEKQKDYAPAVEVLNQYLQGAPNDQLARCLLLNIYIRTSEKRSAIEQLAILKQQPIPASLSAIVSTMQVVVHNFELESSLDKALLALKGADAMTLVDQMYLSSEQKELVKYYIDLRRGNLTSAMMRTGLLERKTNAPADSNAASELRLEVAREADLFAKIQDRIAWYRYSPLSTGSCTSDWIRQQIPKQHYEIQHEYMELIANAEKQFPLSPWVLDHAFFATLLSDRPYEDLESFGDFILEAKGTLRLPFYSREALFDVVLDTRNRRIRTEMDDRLPKNESGVDKIPTLLVFDISFDQLTGIDQKASADLATGGLASNSYALRIEPSGLAPRYTFMDAIQCLDGESKQKEVTQKLGRFIAHVINNPRLNNHLVNPEHKTADWMRSTSTIIAFGSVIGAQEANMLHNGANAAQANIVSQEALQVIRQNKQIAAAEQSVALAQDEERSAWHADLSRLVFSSVETHSAESLAANENRLLAIANNAFSQ